MHGPEPAVWDDTNAPKLSALGVTGEGWGLPWRYGPRATDGGFGESWGACMSTEIISSLEYDMTCQTNQPWSNVCWADKVLRYLGRHITIWRLCGCFCCSLAQVLQGPFIGLLDH